MERFTINVDWLPKNIAWFYPEVLALKQEHTEGKTNRIENEFSIITCNMYACGTSAELIFPLSISVSDSKWLIQYKLHIIHNIRGPNDKW